MCASARFFYAKLVWIKIWFSLMKRWAWTLWGSTAFTNEVCVNSSSLKPGVRLADLISVWCWTYPTKNKNYVNVNVVIYLWTSILAVFTIGVWVTPFGSDWFWTPLTHTGLWFFFVWDPFGLFVILSIFKPIETLQCCSQMWLLSVVVSPFLKFGKVQTGFETAYLKNSGKAWVK